MAAAKNAMQMPNLRMPTGYESEQRKIERRRRIAQAMLEMGISPGPVSSWTQVLAKLAQTWVGKSEDKKATKMEGEMYDRMQADLSEKIARYQEMRKNGATNEQINDAFGTDPMMEAFVKPHQDAFSRALTEREDIIKSGDKYVPQGEVIGKYDPGSITDPVLRDSETGAGYINPLATASAQVRQMVPADAESAQMLQNMTFNPNAAGGPQPLPANPGSTSPGASPAQATTPGLDFSKFNPSEMQILQEEIARRNGLPQENMNIPQGNPLTPPPSKVIDGKPYWSVGGKWFDNPEGR